MGYYYRPDGGGYDSYSPGGYSHRDGHFNYMAVERASSDYSGGGGGGSGGGSGGGGVEEPFWLLLLIPVLVPLVMIGVPILIWLIYKGFVDHPIEIVMLFAVAIIATGWAKYHERRSWYLPSGPKLSEARDRAEKMARIAVLLWWAAVLVSVALSVNTVFLTPQPEVHVQKVQKGNREYVRGHLYNPEDVRGGREGPVRTLLWEEIPSPQEGWKLVTEALYGRSSLERSIPTAEVKRLIQELANPENGGAVARLLNFDHSTAVHHSLRARYRLEEIRIDEASHNPNYSWRDNPYHPRHQFGSK
jgi:hypothetical protein